MKEKKIPKLNYEPMRDVTHTVNCTYRSIDAVSPHFHQSIEITYLLKGKVDFYIGEERFALSAGEMTFVPAYHTHCAVMPRDGEETWAIVLIVPKHYYEEFMHETENASYFFLGDKSYNRAVGERMKELADGMDGMSDLLVRAYVNMVFGLISQHYTPVWRKDTHGSLMMEIISYIDEHYAEELSLEKLSERFGYSKYYFSRLFNKTFHCNLNSYVNGVRARAVLAGTAEKKTEAILESGFNSLSTYYRTVK